MNRVSQLIQSPIHKDSPLTRFWMNRLNELINDSLIKNRHLLPPTGGLVIFKSVIAFFQHLFVCLKKYV